jgi:hypothetical protein
VAAGWRKCGMTRNGLWVYERPSLSRQEQQERTK